MFFQIIEQSLIFGEHEMNFNFIVGQLWLKNYLIWNKENLNELFSDKIYSNILYELCGLLQVRKKCNVACFLKILGTPELKFFMMLLKIFSKG